MMKPLFEESPTFPFGKYRGESLDTITDLDYLDWVIRQRANPNFYHADWVDEYYDELRAKLTAVPEEYVDIEQKLNPGQRRARDEIVENLIYGDGLVHRLQGAAGYGKSFTVAPVVIAAKRQGFMVRGCATSYVATQNLAQGLDPLGVKCSTIASLLRLDVTYNGPREIYEPGLNTYEVLPELLEQGNLLIIDEYSMVDDIIGELLIDAAVKYGGRLLVVGDAWQLPSPSQNWDSILCQIEPVSTLTIPERYSITSDLYGVEQLTRITPYQFNPHHYNPLGDVQTVSDMEELVQRYVDLHTGNDDEESLTVWFRRANMTAANQLIRARLFGDDAPDVCETEALRVQRTSDYLAHAGALPVRFYSGTTIRAHEIEHEAFKEVYLPEMDRAYRIPVTIIKPRDDLPVAVIFSVTEGQASTDKRGGSEFNTALKEISAWCKDTNHWEVYRLFRANFVQVAYHYASTVHRVQGQSVDNVITSPNELKAADSFQAPKLLYVGLTRAKKRLICL